MGVTPSIRRKSRTEGLTLRFPSFGVTPSIRRKNTIEGLTPSASIRFASYMGSHLRIAEKPESKA